MDIRLTVRASVCVRKVWRPFWRLTRWIGPAVHDAFAPDVGEDYQAVVGGLVVSELVFMGFALYIAGSVSTSQAVQVALAAHYALGALYRLHDREWGNWGSW